MSKNTIVSSIIGLTVGVIIGTGAVVSAVSNVVVKELPAGTIVQIQAKTGMELVGYSTDKDVRKYVDYDADVVCYLPNRGSSQYPIAISCLHL